MTVGLDLTRREMDISGDNVKTELTRKWRYDRNPYNCFITEAGTSENGVRLH